jgi:hypothetical protein
MVARAATLSGYALDEPGITEVAERNLALHAEAGYRVRRNWDRGARPTWLPRDFRRFDATDDVAARWGNRA